MDEKTHRVWIILIISVVLLVSLGCSGISVSVDTVDVGDTQTLSHTIEMDKDVEKVRVDLKMSAGSIEIDSETDELMEGELTYNVEDWEPVINYDVDHSTGRLAIRQPHTKDFAIGDEIRYSWDLNFNEDIPLYLRIDIGGGDVDLKLGDMSIKELDLKAGAGEVTIDLSGNDTLSLLECDIGAGEVTLDLRGDWEANVDILINGGLGQTTVKLPEDIGVRVNAVRGIGDINASGLHRDGEYYVNDAYQEGADVTLNIDIRAGIGQINLQVMD